MKLKYLKPGFSLIELIDNTKTQKFIKETYFKHFSEGTRNLFPNQARLLVSNEFSPDDIIFFDSTGLTEVKKNLYAIADSNIFMLNSKLIKSGVAVKKKNFKQKFKAFHYRSQAFFEVDQSSIGIKPGQIIVARPDLSTRFVKDSDTLFFVKTGDIMFYLTSKGIMPGDGYRMVKAIESQTKLIKHSKIEQTVGIYGKSKLYFKKWTTRINLSGKQYYIVKKENIYAQEAI